jgi:hypothetical protein
VPAAAVIPAPLAYIKIAAVKRLVVEYLPLVAWPDCYQLCRQSCCGLRAAAAFCSFGIIQESFSIVLSVGKQLLIIYFDKIRAIKAGLCT